MNVFITFYVILGVMVITDISLTIYNKIWQFEEKVVTLHANDDDRRYKVTENEQTSICKVTR